MSTSLPRDDLTAPLVLLLKGGVTFRTLIDVGSADGTYGLMALCNTGIDFNLFNIDPQSLYEPSLKAIAEQVGGAYRICGIGSNDGTAYLAKRHQSGNLNVAGHPYFFSVGPAGSDAVPIPVRSLDSLLPEVGLPGPYVLKIDVEGSEMLALIGAERSLSDIAAILVETNIFYGRVSGPKFIDIYTYLASRGFSLFDIVNLAHRPSDANLFMCYSCFINNAVDFRESVPYAAGDRTADVVADMEQRQDRLRRLNGELIARIRERRSATQVGTGLARP